MQLRRHSTMHFSADEGSNDTVKEGWVIFLSLALLILVMVVAVICYRRYRVRLEYNQTLEYFSNKPDLGIVKQINFMNAKLQALSQQITIVAKELHDGKNYEVHFGGQSWECCFYHRRQTTTTYFQIEIVQLNSLVEFGFVQCEDISKLKGGHNLTEVSLNTEGMLSLSGVNHHSYKFPLTFGDTLGLGVSKEEGQNQRRVWVTRNGVLLNPPPSDEIASWISNAKFNKQQKIAYISRDAEKKGIDKKENEDHRLEAHQKQLLKHRVALSLLKRFQYYPVISCSGNPSEVGETIINVNVGAQTFRMPDEHFRSGLLG